MKLQDFPDTFLLIARQVDELAAEFPSQARSAAVEYLAIDSRRQGVQVAFGSMFMLISMTVLLSAVWFGLSFADRLVAPIRRLIHATDQVATGKEFRDTGRLNRRRRFIAYVIQHFDQYIAKAE